MKPERIQKTMEKQQEAAAPDSISTVGVQMKDYPPSEVYSSEPPPAYVRPRATAVQIARIAAVTMVAVSFILGFFMLASAYVTATATCYTDYPPQQENVAEDRPQFQHLVADPLDSEESAHNKQESFAPPQERENEQQSHDQPIQLKLPLQLDFDELAGSMIEKNQRSRMNCVVEKRRAEEVTDHQPRTVRLPFGVNISSDPRYEHITGERMAIFCESGADQRHVPMEQQMGPVIVPIPVHQMPIHPNAIPQVQLHPNAIPQHPQVGPQFHPHMHPRPIQIQVQQHQQQQQQMPPQMQQLPPQIQIHSMHQLPPQFPPQAVVEQAIHQFEQQALHQSPEEHQVIIQEEEVMPVMRGFQHPEVPADTVRPPPLPFHRLPIHLPQQQQAQPQQIHPQQIHTQQIHPQQIHPQQIQEIQQLPQPQQQQEHRPHFVQPRSVRSVDAVLHRDKRVRRCACDCAC